MNKITVEIAQEILSELVNEAVAKGSLILNSTNSINFLISQALQKSKFEVENTELKAKILDLESQLKNK